MKGALFVYARYQSLISVKVTFVELEKVGF